MTPRCREDIPVVMMIHGRDEILPLWEGYLTWLKAEVIPFSQSRLDRVFKKRSRELLLEAGVAQRERVVELVQQTGYYETATQEVDVGMKAMLAVEQFLDEDGAEALYQSEGWLQEAIELNKRGRGPDDGGAVVAC